MSKLTIIQALKRIKHLDRKITKNSERVKRWASYLSDEEPLYEPRPLIQSISDMLSERAAIRHALHKLNAMNLITFEGKKVTVDELLLMSTYTLPKMIEVLSSQRRKEKGYSYTDKPNADVKVVMQYEPKERDMMIDSIEQRIEQINNLLDEVNISTTIDI